LAKLIRSGKVPVGRVLELGCGRGTNALYLAEQGFDVTATDISPSAISEAGRMAGERGLKVDLRVADLTALPDLGGAYDFLFDRGVYHAVRQTDLGAFLRLLAEVSREGTKYLCLCGNAREKHDPGPPTVTGEEIRAELGSLFDILDLHEFRFDKSPNRLGRPLGWSVFMRRRNG
jgi:cyclopropane fatty-acyl-phospholipid synthase-like methyltransferase